METVIIILGFVLAGAIIGWTANECVRKFRADRIGMQLRDAREKAAADNEAERQTNRAIIEQAERIIEAHLRAKKVFKALREDEDNEC